MSRTYMTYLLKYIYSLLESPARPARPRTLPFRIIFGRFLLGFRLLFFRAQCPFPSHHHRCRGWVALVGEYTPVFIPPQACLGAYILACIRMSVCMCICCGGVYISLYPAVSLPRCFYSCMYSYVRVYVYMSCVSIHQSSSRRKLAYVLLFLRVFVCPCVCVYVVGGSRG